MSGGIARGRKEFEGDRESCGCCLWVLWVLFVGVCCLWVLFVGVVYLRHAASAIPSSIN